MKTEKASSKRKIKVVKEQTKLFLSDRKKCNGLVDIMTHFEVKPCCEFCVNSKYMLAT